MATDKIQKAFLEYGVIDNTSAQLKNMASATDKYAESSKKATDAQKDLNKALNLGKKEVDDYEVEFEALNAEFEEYIKNNKLSLSALKDFRSRMIKARDAATVTTEKFAQMSTKVKNVSNSITKFSAEGNRLTKVNGDMQSSTGLASAAVIEFGRGVSDAGFGITGVANNIQQFAAMFVTLRKESGGTKQAIQGMVTQFMGPLGILVAFQGAIALLEFLNRKFDLFGEKADEAAKKLQNQKTEVIANAEQLRGYAMVLDDANSSEEARKVAVEELTNALPSLTEEELNSKDALELTNLAIEEYIKNQSLRIEIDALLEKNQDVFAKQRKIRFIEESDDEEKLDKMKEFLSENEIGRLKRRGLAGRQILADLGKEDLVGRARQKVVQDEMIGLPEDEIVKLAFRRFKSTMSDEYESAISKIKELQSQLTDSEVEENTSADNLAKEEERRQKQLLSLTNRFAERLEDARAENEQQRLNIQKDRDLEEAERLGASAETLKTIEDYYRILSFDLFMEDIEKKREERIKADEDRIKQEEKTSKQVTRIAQRESRERLKLEKDVIKGKQQMQLEGVRFAQMIAGLLRNINENDKVLKTISFILEKGSAIASVIIKSSASIASQTASVASANAMALAKYPFVPFPLSLKLAGAEIAANNAMLAKGVAMTKLGAALSIGSIAATSIKGKGGGGSVPSPPTGGAVGVAGGTPQPPNFNIVGASPQSQLAQTIAQAEQQPTRAYVVAEDVTTAQQLDRNIIQGASLG